MWIPAIIALGVLVISSMVRAVLFVNDFLRERSIPDTVLTCAGMYVPLTVIGVNYSYLKTDTSREAVIVFAGIVLSVTLLYLFPWLWRTKKYNFIIFPIIAFSGLLILSLITPFMLSHIPALIYTNLVSAILGSSLRQNPYKGRLIISGIIVIIIMIAAPVKLISSAKVQTKVERAAVEYVRERGYELPKDYRIDIWIGANRYSPIRAVIYKWDSDPDTLFDLTYYEGKIAERKE